MSKLSFALLFALLFAFFIHRTTAQVSIGSLEKPNRAALLDLKSNSPKSDNTTTGANGGGLLLPRVSLESKTTLQPFIPTTDTEWQSKADELKKKHAGLMVYNLNDSSGFKPGIYCWNGTEWQSSGNANGSGNWTIGGDSLAASTPSVLGTLSNDSLSIVSNGKQKIILGKKEGELYIKDLPKAPSKGTVPLQVSENGQVFALVNEDNYDTKPFTYIKFVIYTTNVPTAFRDWVSNFNTKINADKFVLTIIGSAFQINMNGTIRGALMKSMSAVANTFGTSQIYAFVDNGTWRIRADYAEADVSNTSAGISYQWLIYALVINKSMISDIYEIQGKIPDWSTTGESGGEGYADTPAELQ
jgi:hypothetical protein